MSLCVTVPVAPLPQPALCADRNVLPGDDSHGHQRCCSVWMRPYL